MLLIRLNHRKMDSLLSTSSSRSQEVCYTSLPAFFEPVIYDIISLGLINNAPIGDELSSISANPRPEGAQPPVPSISQILPSAPRFEFINTTGPQQYSEADARTRARAHVMRQVHMEKDKERSSRGSGSGLGPTRANPADTSLANLASEWVEEGGLRSPSGISTGMERPTDSSLLFAPIVTPSSRRDTAAGPAYNAREMQELRIGTEADKPASRSSTPLPILGGMDQRLVVPQTISPGGFAVDLNAVERVRHCELGRVY